MPMADMPHNMSMSNMPIHQAIAVKQTASNDDMAMHQHGSEIYSATSLDNKWRVDKTGHGQLQSELNSWVGSDINKLYIKAEFDKAESKNTETEVKALYSRNVSPFWDVQTGLRYRQNLNLTQNKQAIDLVLGVHGLAPYFFETDAYVYVGEHQYSALYLESTRDVLLTQKWIMTPFVKALWLVQDETKSAQKTGLAHAEIGIQSRYELNKKIMPFVEVAYRHENGQQQTREQIATPSETGWIYGGGFKLNF
ncbi:copper resistance protein B [Acinetobacter sp. MD2]|nr:copper resistance protein B [Acinetobacter sp. MD2]